MITSRRFMSIFVLTLVSLAMSAVSPLALAAQETPNPEAYSFVISHIEGQVRMLRSEQKSWLPANFILTSDSASTEGLESANEGDLLAAGDTIFTGDESGAILELENGVKLLLAQRTALNVEITGGTAAVPDIHLRLDAGLVATVPGATLPPEATFEIAVPDATSSERRVWVRGWDPEQKHEIVGIQSSEGDSSLIPAVMVGHDPESGDVVVSVLDGTAELQSGDEIIEIPAGYLMMNAHKLSPVKHLIANMTMPMSDQDLAVWVSALRFGDNEPTPFPILEHIVMNDPAPFPVYALVHSDEGDEIHLEVSHTADHAQQTDDEQHADTEDHDTVETSHTDSEHTDAEGHGSGNGEDGSHASGGEHIEPTEEHHDG